MEKIKKRKHLIAATASYHGDLIKDFYQFTWNKQNVNYFDQNNKFNGFLVPGSGRIKKIYIIRNWFKNKYSRIKNFFRFCKF